MRRAFFLLAALLLVCLPARAEGDVRAVVDALDLQGFEETVGETGIDAREMLISIASGEETWELSDVLARLRDAFFEESRRAAALVAALLAPALFSAIARQLAGEGGGADLTLDKSSALWYTIFRMSKSEVITCHGT